jgi:DNA-binding NtrC family response regulator
VLDILLIDDEPELLEILEEQLVEAGHRVQTASDGAQGMEQLGRRVFDLMICDMRLPLVDGLTLFRQARKQTPSTEVILMTAYAEVGQAVAALKEGAYDYLIKPFDVDQLLIAVQRIAETVALRRELEKTRDELSSRCARPTAEQSLIGDSPAIRRAIDVSRMVSASDAPVLVTGETGTGKELVARLIHEKSSRRDKPFVAVNCGALSETLIEAELFGHERGAFTGAAAKRDGRFKAADGGVLFLDEIAELPIATQAKLLRVLQEGTFEPLGTNTPVRVDVRIVSATHRRLPERIKAGLFREDLYYRVNGIEIQLPALRDRRSDLPLLMQHFVRMFTVPGQPFPKISPAAWARLRQHEFPGNVRELAHAVQHAMVLSGGEEIDLHHLPPSIAGDRTSASLSTEWSATAIRPLQLVVREFENQYLRNALKVADGNRNRTAAILGISRKTLWEKLRHDRVLPSPE